jgi:hypothetical protein
MNAELKKWLDALDAGEPVESVEIGGFGAGYEGAIQSLAVAIMRDLVNLEQLDWADLDKVKSVIELIRDEKVSLLDGIHRFSGAQVGAAGQLAYLFWRFGPEKRNDVPDRIIKIWQPKTGLGVIDVYTIISPPEGSEIITDPKAELKAVYPDLRPGQKMEATVATGGTTVEGPKPVVGQTIIEFTEKSRGHKLVSYYFGENENVWVSSPANAPEDTLIVPKAEFDMTIVRL